MSDFKVFEGKSLSDVFKDIYDNSATNKKQLDILIKEIVGFIKDADTAVQLIPAVKEYLEIKVKNKFQSKTAKTKVFSLINLLYFKYQI